MQAYENVRLLCQKVGEESIFADCLVFAEWRRFREMCEYDMCARLDQSDHTPLCVYVSALAAECQLFGVTIDWTVDEELSKLCSGICIIPFKSAGLA